jgi:hypothetical protein
MRLDLRGAAGRVCWSYHVAAVVGKFTIVSARKSKTSTLRAMVVSVDPYKVQQSPLVFEITNGSGLRWPIQDAAIKDGILTATIET